MSLKGIIYTTDDGYLHIDLPESTYNKSYYIGGKNIIRLKRRYLDR
jgi:hypothetical protein